jgi:glucose/arabinose dehydrogenase
MPQAVAAPLTATGLPAGFTDSLVTTAVAAPVAVTALPDGRAVVLAKGGQARVLRNGVLVAKPALTLSVCTEIERGLLGFAVDPGFGVNGYVYVYYTRRNASAPGGCVNRVSRFTMHGDVIDPASQRVLLDNIGSPGGNHNGGDLAIGNDGYLYVSVGDGGCDPRNDSGCAGSNNAAQDRSLLNGKILRVQRATGAPASGNPFTGANTAVCRTRGNGPSTPGTWCREIYAYGLRNPWRFAFDENTGATRFFIDDVGQDSREEVDLGRVGANYGWPLCEGRFLQASASPCPSAYVPPLTDYPHNAATGGEYVTGGAFVPKGGWPKPFDGGYLFADGNPGKIFFRSAAGTVDYLHPFASGVSTISDMGFVMDAGGWSLYYVLPGMGQVRRITPSRSAIATSPGLLYAPAKPAKRLYDTRRLGASSGPMRAGTTRLVNVTRARGSHRAALLNVVMITPTGDGALTLWTPRTLRPGTVAVNGQNGLVSANSAIVPLDADGNVEVHSSVTSHVLIDLLGYFDLPPAASSRAGRYTPTALLAAIDTRNPPSSTNVYTRRASGGDSIITVPVARRYGLPATGRISSVVLGVLASADSGAARGSVVAYASGAALPSVSHLNTNGNGDVRANTVVVPVGADGSVVLRLHVTADVVVGVLGWFSSSSASPATTGRYVFRQPARVVDTRRAVGFRRLAAGADRSVNPTVVPNNARAVVQNVAMVRSGGLGNLVAHRPGLSPIPAVLAVRTTGVGQTRSGQSFTAMASGAVAYRTTTATDVIADVTGWFT